MTGNPDDRTCQELAELATEYLEGALLPHERSRLEAHLRRCRRCRVLLQQLRATVRLTRRLSEEASPTGAKEALLAAFREWRRA